MSEIKCRLSVILGCKRMSQRELARKSGLSTTTVNKLYNDTWNQVDRRTLGAVCKALNITLGDLLIYTEKK